MIFVTFKMATAAVLNCQKFEILTVDFPKEANMHHHAVFHQKQLNC